MNIPEQAHCKRIVLTGGPGGGKTTALDLFRRELANQVSIVPEAATMLFRGGVERSQAELALIDTQIMIYQLQKNLETLQQTLYPQRLLLCDRGTLDGAAYWPTTQEEFFKTANTDLQTELNRYDAVIFFETAAKARANIHSNNPARIESDKEAIELDSKLYQIWSQHPVFHHVPGQESFIKKIMTGIMTIQKVLHSV